MIKFVGVDPSTRTGLVIINEDGTIDTQEEIVNPADTASSMAWLINDVVKFVNGERRVVFIENFGFGSKQGFQLGGIGWGIRMELFKRGQDFQSPAPTQVKKFATGSGNADKRQLAVDVSKRWDFFSKSDNITDAFVLAHMARCSVMPDEYTKAQQNVVQAVLEPPKKKGKTKGA